MRKAERIFEKLKLIYRALVYRYTTDRNEIKYLNSVLKPGDIAMDAGAHKGAYTFWMQKKVGSKGKVIAFEPQPSGFHLLKKILSKKTTVENMALSNQKGEQDFFIQQQNNSVSYEATLERPYSNSSRIVVKTDTLDNYCFSRNIKPSFIKIDVEGHEVKLLMGALKIIAAARPVLLIEAEARHSGVEGLKSLISIMTDLSYQGYFFLGNRKTSINQFSIEAHQDLQHLGTRKYSNNFIFEPAAGTLSSVSGQSLHKPGAQ